MIALGYLSSFLYAALCILVAFVLSRLGVKKNITRKVVHIAIGFEWVILYSFFGSSFHFLTVCLVCSLLLFAEYRLRLVPALSSDGDNAPGTVYYGLAMSVMALISIILPEMMLPFGIGVFATSVGDGMAGVVGQLIKRKNPKIYGNKTLFGTLSGFLFTFFGVLLFKYCFDLPIAVWQALLVALFVASLELVSSYGLDNITVTLGAALISYAFINIPEVNGYLVPIILTPLIILLANKKRILSGLGILFAVILDVLVSVAFGNAGFLILLAFLLLSVATDKVKSAYKKKQGTHSLNSEGARGALQVLANGAMGAVCAVLFIITKSQVFAVIYVASIAEALSDTAASGIGVLSKTTFDPFKFKRCEKGISGGMSLVGTAAAILGALVISALALALGVLNLTEALTAMLCATMGMIFDSALGSLIQAKYKCPVCQKITESKTHCQTKTQRFSGLSFVNNDFVNIASNIFTALLTALIFYI